MKTPIVGSDEEHKHEVIIKDYWIFIGLAIIITLFAVVIILIICLRKEQNENRSKSIYVGDVNDFDAKGQ